MKAGVDQRQAYLGIDDGPRQVDGAVNHAEHCDCDARLPFAVALLPPVKSRAARRALRAHEDVAEALCGCARPRQLAHGPAAADYGGPCTVASAHKLVADEAARLAANDSGAAVVHPHTLESPAQP
eukprot:4906743-Prymnesium_polylepis.1